MGGERGVVDTFVVLLVVSSLAFAGVGGALGSQSTGAAGEPPNVGGPLADVPVQNDSSANNSTVHHVDPNAVGDGEASAVSGYLAREMADQLSGSLNASQSQMARAKRLVGNDSRYANLAEKYREVNGDSASPGGRIETFSEVGFDQRAFLANVTQYRQAHDRYRRVRNGTNRTRERVLAHELADLAREVNRSATRLNRSYENASTDSEVGLDTATETVGELRANVTRTQRTVRRQSLVATRLTLRTESDGGSFTDPFAFVGRLRTADGAAVADEPVRFRVGNRTVDATTGPDGRFRVTYRPTLDRAGQRQQVVRYRPENDSRYGSSSARVRFEVRQVAPNVTIAEPKRTTAVEYGSNVTVAGTVGAEGVGASGVPVVVSVGGTRLNRTTTGPNGRFGVAAPLPANVSAGERRVSVRVPLSNRALAGTTAATELAVEPTQTALGIANATTFGKSVLVSGRLRTASGTPVPNQTVVLRIDGEPVARAITNATGGYAATANVSSQVAERESLRVNATYEAVGTNLRPSQAAATISVPSGGSWTFDLQMLLSVVGVLGVAAVGMFVWRFRSDASFFEPNATDDRGATDGDGRATHVSDPDQSSGDLLDAAEAALDSGRSDATVVASYAAVRRRLAAAVESSPSTTHWEFYADCRAADLPDERLRRLERLTERVEQAAFASESVSMADARESLQLASRFRSEGDSSPGAPSDD